MIVSKIVTETLMRDAVYDKVSEDVPSEFTHIEGTDLQSSEEYFSVLQSPYSVPGLYLHLI